MALVRNILGRAGSMNASRYPQVDYYEDLYTGDLQLTSFDVHIEIDQVGSNEEYVK